MAKKQNTIPPVPEEFRRQYISEYACFPISWSKRVAGLPDDVAGRLLKAVLEHCECGKTTPPAGVDAFAFGLVLDKVDEYQEKGLEFAWKKKYLGQIGAQGRWKEGEQKQTRAEYTDGCGRMRTDTDGCHTITSTPIPTSTLKDKTNLQPAREVSRELVGLEGLVNSFLGWDYDNDLSAYLTPEEEERLTEGPGNYDNRYTALFVRSEYFNAGDDYAHKAEKMMQFVDALNNAIYAREEAERSKKEGAERAASLATYPHGQKPGSLEELQAFCKDIGHPEFAAALFWSEMEFHGWEIQEKNGSWRPVKDWQNFVKYRIKMEADKSGE